MPYLYIKTKLLLFEQEQVNPYTNLFPLMDLVYMLYQFVWV